MISLILVSLLSTAFAANFFPVEKAGANTTYSDQSACEKAEGIQCWEISSCDPLECSVQDVDDPTKPIFRKENVKACADKESCAALLEGLCKEGEALINAEYTEVYCAVPAGFEKMKGLAVDSAKRAKREADRLAERIEKETREAKRADRAADLKTCLKNDNPSVKQISDCVRILIKESLKDDLSPNEL